MGLDSPFPLLLKVRNIWSYTLTPHTFPWCLIKHRNNFTSVVKSATKEDYCLLGCDALYSFKYLPMFCGICCLHLQDRNANAWEREQTVLKGREDKERG
jgi:hypothetical protein